MLALKLIALLNLAIIVRSTSVQDVQAIGFYVFVRYQANSPQRKQHAPAFARTD